MKKLIKRTLLILSTLLLIAGCFGIAYYCNYFRGWTEINNGKVTGKELPTNSFKPVYEAKLKFEDAKVEPANDVKISLLGNSLNVDNQVLIKSLRYYIPIETLTSSLKYETIINTNIVNIKNKDQNIQINLDNNTVKLNDRTVNLRGNHIIKNNKIYISLSDIENIFNLFSHFNYESKIVNLVNSETVVANDTPMSTDGKVALLRLEDFGGSVHMTDETAHVKMKIVAKFLNANGMKYHVAWVPRFVAPNQNIDNDLLKDNSIRNVAFLTTIDTLINNGAMFGIHGYTHAFGDETSFSGTEFSKDANNTEEATRSIIENAIDTASALNIDVNFFESPHFGATKMQLEVLEEYFQYMYQPMNVLNYDVLKLRNNNLYVPTPLTYVKDLNVEPILKRLEKPRPSELSSLYYHPTKELDFIDFKFTDDQLTYDYSTNSPLQQIVSKLQEEKYSPIHITQLQK